ncbi:MAG: DUF2306 domain-containing protein [Aestuariivirga sp.]|uniref:DUF2306 domain-containing protein n=1 Tax=Aestuariivirga sp. TaxID=2650926 RepID=UPI0038D2385D
MSVEPLINAPLPIQLHAAAAVAALVLGAAQLWRPKGGARHRFIGYAWAALMLLIAVSGFFIHEIRLIGPFSPIHLLSFVILLTVPLAVVFARRGNIAGHRRSMLSIYWIALIVAGIFTLLPGRLLGQVLFGQD